MALNLLELIKIGLLFWLRTRISGITWNLVSVSNRYTTHLEHYVKVNVNDTHWFLKYDLSSTSRFQCLGNRFNIL